MYSPKGYLPFGTPGLHEGNRGLGAGTGRLARALGLASVSVKINFTGNDWLVGKVRFMHATRKRSTFGEVFLLRKSLPGGVRVEKRRRIYLRIREA